MLTRTTKTRLPCADSLRILCESEIDASGDFIAFHIVIVFGFAYGETRYVFSEVPADTISDFLCQVVSPEG